MAKAHVIQEQADARYRKIKATPPIPLGKPSDDFPSHVVTVLAQLPEDRSLYSVVEAVIKEAVDFSFGIDQVIKILRTNNDIQGTLLNDLHDTVQSVFPKPKNLNEDFSSELMQRTVASVSHYFLVPSNTTTLYATLTNLKNKLSDDEYGKVCTLINSPRFTEMLMQWFNSLMERIAQHTFKKIIADPETAQSYFNSFVMKLVSAGNGDPQDAVLRGFMEIFADAIAHDVKPELVDGLIQQARREKKGLTPLDRIVHGTRAGVSETLSAESVGYLSLASRAVTDTSIIDIQYLNRLVELIEHHDISVVRETGSLSVIMIELIKGADRLGAEKSGFLGDKLVSSYCKNASVDELKAEFYNPRQRTLSSGRFDSMKK